MNHDRYNTTEQINLNCEHLQEVSYVYQQPVRTSWNTVPHAVSKNLKSTNIFVHEKNGKNTAVRMRLDAKDKIWSWTGWVVVESGKTRSLATKLGNDVVFVKS